MKKQILALILILMLIPVIPTAAVEISSAGTTPETSCSIERDIQYTSGFDTPGEADYYNFTAASEDAYYIFQFNGLDCFRSMALSVYDESGSAMLEAGSYDGRLSKTIKLSAGLSYYLCLKNRAADTGRYEFSVTTHPDPHPDMKSGAVTIQRDRKIAASFAAEEDLDYMKLTTAESDSYYRFQLTEPGFSEVLNLSVYDQAGNSVLEAGSNEGRIDKTILLKPDSVYDICLKSNAGYIGNYEFSVTTQLIAEEQDEKEQSEEAEQYEGEQSETDESPAASPLPCSSGHRYNNGKCSVCSQRDADYTPTFIDVSEKAWYKSAIDYVAKYNIMNGVGNGMMLPESNVTRAQFVQILANLENVDTKNTQVPTPFSDVPAGKWFTPAVKWASENGIVNGIGHEKFDPNGNLTREQMCKMILSYAKFKGITLHKTLPQITFTDDKDISSWAYDDVHLCGEAGLIKGIGTEFKPLGLATRAQVATIMMRFDQQYGIIQK